MKRILTDIVFPWVGREGRILNPRFSTQKATRPGVWRGQLERAFLSGQGGEPRLQEWAYGFPGGTLRRTLPRKRLPVTTPMGFRNLSP